MYKLSISDTDKKVATFLKSIDVVMTVKSIEIDKVSIPWRQDYFSLEFNGQQFDYTAGVGHRICNRPSGGIKQLESLGIEGQLRTKAIPAWDHQTKLMVIDSMFITFNAVAPTQANVLYRLLSDANLGQELFEDFCSDCGYDEDSRKAFEVYQACQKTASKLRKFLTYEQTETLEEMLQDY